MCTRFEENRLSYVKFIALACSCFFLRHFVIEFISYRELLDSGVNLIIVVFFNRPFVISSLAFPTGGDVLWMRIALGRSLMHSGDVQCKHGFRMPRFGNQVGTDERKKRVYHIAIGEARNLFPERKKRERHGKFIIHIHYICQACILLPKPQSDVFKFISYQDVKI